MDKRDLIIVILGAFVAAFLGSFCAISVMHSSHKSEFYRHNPHLRHHMGPERFQGIQFDNSQNIMGEDFQGEDDLQKELKEEAFRRIHSKNMHGVKVFKISDSALKMSETADGYKIVFDLKQFNNDPKNVKIKTDDHQITIWAKYESKETKDFTSAKFMEKLYFPHEIDESSLVKKLEGSNLVITVKKDVD